MPYKDPEKHKAYHKAYNAEYRKTDKNKDAQKRYHTKKLQQGICRICKMAIFKQKLCEKHYNHNLERLAAHTKKKTEFVRRIKLYYGCTNPKCEWKGILKPYHYNFIILMPQLNLEILAVVRKVLLGVYER